MGVCLHVLVMVGDLLHDAKHGPPSETRHTSYPNPPEAVAKEKKRCARRDETELAKHRGKERDKRRAKESWLVLCACSPSPNKHNGPDTSSAPSKTNSLSVVCLDVQKRHWANHTLL